MDEDFEEEPEIELDPPAKKLKLTKDRMFLALKPIKERLLTVHIAKKNYVMNVQYHRHVSGQSGRLHIARLRYGYTDFWSQEYTFPFQIAYTRQSGTDLLILRRNNKESKNYEYK